MVLVEIVALIMEGFVEIVTLAMEIVAFLARTIGSKRILLHYSLGLQPLHGISGVGPCHISLPNVDFVPVLLT